MKYIFSHNRLVLSCIALLSMTSMFVALATGTGTAYAAVDNTPDCDNVAIIRCGTFSESALKDAYDKNEYGGLKQVFDAFGISRSEMNGFTDGIVYRDGRVVVDGETVATNATTAGRNYGGTPIANTENAAKYSTSKFVTDGQTAMVKMIDGKFSFAVIKSCGNPVTATPKTPEPKPTYSCKDVSADKISRTKYEFTATGTADNGAKITGYRFTFGDGTNQTTTSRTVSHTYAKEGTYTVRVEVRVEVNGETKYVDGKNCDVSVKVTPPPAPKQIEVCNPETGETITVNESDQDKYRPVGDAACEEEEETPVTPVATTPTPKDETPAVIPSTGSAELVAGGIGLSSLTAASYYFRASRRNLIDKLLNK